MQNKVDVFIGCADRLQIEESPQRCYFAIAIVVHVWGQFRGIIVVLGFNFNLQNVGSVRSQANTRPRNGRRGEIHKTKAQDYRRRVCEATPKRHLRVIAKFAHRPGQRELFDEFDSLPGRQFSSIEHLDAIHAIFAEPQRCRYRLSIDRMRIGNQRQCSPI